MYTHTQGGDHGELPALGAVGDHVTAACEAAIEVTDAFPDISEVLQYPPEECDLGWGRPLLAVACVARALGLGRTGPCPGGFCLGRSAWSASTRRVTVRRHAVLVARPRS